MNIPQLEPKLKSIPEIPLKFGEDGGHFYKYYDSLADELDEDMVKSLKAQLDGIVIFAGLFAGVNSAFLALTLPEMTADPADDTNALLLQLVTGDNSTIRNADDLPSATFTPSPNIVPVNILFSLSLTLALIASFLAVLGQQWLVYYRKRSGGGAEYQRWEQLRRYLGAQRWGLEAILDDVLPALLQLALVIFCVAFVLYLRTLNKTIYYVIAIPMAVAMAILLLMAIMAFLDQWCPFKSPLSHFLQLAGRFVQRHRRVWFLILALTYIPLLLSVLAVRIILRARQLARKARIFFARRLWTGYPVPLEFRPSLESFGEDAMDIVIRACSFRSGETATHLQAVAAKRVLCTSEEFNALVYTAINIQAISELECAKCLLDDDAVHERLGELSESREEVLASLFSRAFPHLLLASQSAELFVEQQHRPLRVLHSEMGPFVEEVHPLKKRVQDVCRRLHASLQSHHTPQGDLVGLLVYFELMQLLLDEASESQDLSRWLDRVIEGQPVSKPSTPLVVGVLAFAACMRQTGVESAFIPSPPVVYGEREEWQRQEQEYRQGLEYFLRVQRRRMRAVEKLVAEVGWGLQAETKSFEEYILRQVNEAFRTEPSLSPRRPDRTDVWLLEQTVFILADRDDLSGWKLVAEASVDLLSSFDRVKDTTSDSVSAQESQKDNRFRCMVILSKSLQAVRDNAGLEGVLDTISLSLDQLAEHLERRFESFGQIRDSYHDSTLSGWLEIRDILGEPSKYRGQVDHLGYEDKHARFERAYPRLKSAFDANESAKPDAPIVPNVDGNPADLPPPASVSLDAGQANSSNAVTKRVSTGRDAAIKPLQSLPEDKVNAGTRKPRGVSPNSRGWREGPTPAGRRHLSLGISCCELEVIEEATGSC